jgi:MerR family transcriptional regulator, light-induced transcriptional regulator
MSSSNDEANTTLVPEETRDYATSSFSPTFLSQQVESQAALLRAIESDIIPRLLMTYEQTCEERPRAILAAGSVGELVKHLLGPDSELSTLYLQAQLKRGVPVDTLLLDLMAPAARALGDMWVADDCSFVDVTVGLSRMQRMLRQLRPDVTRPDAGISILLASTPGEQHVFGLRMAEEILSRAGWKVRGVTHATENELVVLAGSEHFDLIGFSISGETLVDSLTSTITHCRAASANKSVGVLIGGAYVVETPGLEKQVGADFVVNDATDALRVAETWRRYH